jgi:phosphocarrier protein
MSSGILQNYILVPIQNKWYIVFVSIRQSEAIIVVSQKVVIKNPTGLHLRPAGILCKEAMQFKSLITFSYRENTANAKSVLSVLGACVKCGDEIEFVCDGIDETEALAKLVQVVENGLGE